MAWNAHRRVPPAWSQSGTQRLATAVRKWAIVAVSSSLVVFPGCGPESGRPQAPEASTTRDGLVLRPVPLPDLSQMAPSAQQQIRTQHAALMAMASAKTTALADLSLAYGEMGKLLMAAHTQRRPRPRCSTHKPSTRASSAGPITSPICIETRASSKSRTLFERALQLRPDDMAALVWTGDVYLSAGLDEAVKNGSSPKALSRNRSGIGVGTLRPGARRARPERSPASRDLPRGSAQEKPERW